MINLDDRRKTQSSELVDPHSLVRVNREIEACATTGRMDKFHSPLASCSPPLSVLIVVPSRMDQRRFRATKDQPLNGQKNPYVLMTF